MNFGLDMSSFQLGTVLLFASLLLSGCGGGQAVYQSYDADSGETTYRTRSYTVSTLSGSNIGSSKSISMQALSQCVGQGCTPTTIQLVFSGSGNQQLQLSGLDGEIVADGARINWSSSDAAQGYTDASDDQLVNVVGEFATISLSTSKVKQIVNASSVRGQIGGQSLNLGSGVRAGLESLVQKMRGMSDESSSDGTQSS
jgi:hypothetical protein